MISDIQQEFQIDSTEQQTQPTTMKMTEIGRENIAGVQFSDYQKAKTIKAGDELNLFWEKNNKFDDRAIRIEWKGIKLGYVKGGSELQDTLHECLENKRKVKAYVVSVNRTNPTWNMFVYRVDAQDIDKSEADEKITK